MVKYILKRVLLAIGILIGVSIIIYFSVRLMPTDYIDNKYQPQLLSGQMTQADIDRIKELYGLADSSFGGILKGYFQWLFKALFQADLGRSMYYELPVTEVIFKNMGISFAIAFVALILQFAIAIPLGIKAATHQYGAVDYTTTVFAMIGISLPTFFLAALLIRVFCQGVGIGLFPAPIEWNTEMMNAGSWAQFVDTVWHLTLPVLTLVILSIGGLMRYTRTNTLEVLNADYIRTARAKGLSEHSVIYKHAFRNTMIPLVTLLAGTLPGLFSGAMITETVFSISGIGRMAYVALQNSDVTFVMGYNMFLAILTVLGTLLSDLMYAVVDPRVKLAK